MVLHVIQVVFKFFLGLHLRRTVAVAHLGPPGDARLHEVAFRVIRNRLRQFLDEGRTLGARADEAHLPGHRHHDFLDPVVHRQAQEVAVELQDLNDPERRKSDLVRQGYDPGATADPSYFNDPERAAFVRLDQALYDRIPAGRFRL